MRTPGFGESRVSSTSGVFPIRASGLPAHQLGTALPHIDSREELPEQLIRPPAEPVRSRIDGSGAVPFDELRLLSAWARDVQQILRDVPLLVFDHALAPLGSEQL